MRNKVRTESVLCAFGEETKRKEVAELLITKLDFSATRVDRRTCCHPAVFQHRVLHKCNDEEMELSAGR